MNPMAAFGIGADVIERNHFDAPLEIVRGLERRVGLLTRSLGDMRAVAFLAVLFEELFAARGLVAIDGAEDLLGPARRASARAACARCACRPAMSTELRIPRVRAAAAARMALSSGVIAPTPSASPTLRASGCDTEPLYCTQSNFQMFHR